MRKLCALLLVLTFAVTAVGCSSSKTPTAIQLTPEQAKERAKEGNDLVRSGKMDDANKALEELAKSGHADAKSFILLGATRYQKKDYQSALEAYDKAIALDATIPDSYQGKANVYRNQSNLKEAETWYRKAWQVNANYIYAYSELGLQFNLAGRFDESVAVLKEGIEKNPQVIDLRLLLASIYAEKNQRELAKEGYQSVLKIDANNKQAMAGLEALAK